MPIYEYECQNCGEIFEKLQSIKEPDPVACIKCEQGPIRRLISKSGFILKGGGFYTNEYPSASRKKNMATENKSKKTDSSPAAATSASPKKDNSVAKNK